MADRYYVPGPIEVGPLDLTGDEAHHLARVRRARPADRIVLFDGAGMEAEAEVVAAGRGTVRVRVLQCRAVDRRLPVALTMLVAVPKADRMDWLVEKCTELGVHRIVPVLCQRSVVTASGSKAQRWRRLAVEACKQCGRNVLPEIGPPLPLAEAQRLAPPPALKLVATPAGQHGLIELYHEAAGPPEVWAAVGPEGGFAPEELNGLTATGFQPVRLTPTILRTETAAVALASAIALEAAGGRGNRRSGPPAPGDDRRRG